MYKAKYLGDSADDNATSSKARKKVTNQQSATRKKHRQIAEGHPVITCAGE